MSEPTPNPDRPAGWGAAILASAGICSLAGTLAGVVWGGIGGRLAMRLLFLTSDERVRGVVTDPVDERRVPPALELQSEHVEPGRRRHAGRDPGRGGQGPREHRLLRRGGAGHFLAE